MSNEDEEDSSALGQCSAQVRSEGFRPGSNAFNLRLNQVKVQRCREMRGQTMCSDCSYYDDCELIKAVMRDNRGIVDEPPDPKE